MFMVSFKGDGHALDVGSNFSQAEVAANASFSICTWHNPVCHGTRRIDNRMLLVLNKLQKDYT